MNVSSDTFSFCVDDLELNHKETYFSTVVAYNGGHKELSVNASSDGGSTKFYSSLIKFASFLEKFGAITTCIICT